MPNVQGMRFVIGLILVCIRWYVAYLRSYRHIEGIMAERGVSVAHSSIKLCCKAWHITRSISARANQQRRAM